jgi:hypothetical protein
VSPLGTLGNSDAGNDPARDVPLLRSLVTHTGDLAVNEHERVELDRLRRENARLRNRTPNVTARRTSVRRRTDRVIEIDPDLAAHRSIVEAVFEADFDARRVRPLAKAAS